MRREAFFFLSFLFLELQIFLMVIWLEIERASERASERFRIYMGNGLHVDDVRHIYEYKTIDIYNL